MMAKVVSANDLVTGAVVFLGASGKWVGALADSERFEDAASAEDGLARAKLDEQRAVVVDPFIVDYKEQTSKAGAMTLRNAIRAFGPTIDYRPAASSAPRAV